MLLKDLLAVVRTDLEFELYDAENNTRLYRVTTKEFVVPRFLEWKVVTIATDSSMFNSPVLQIDIQET